MSGKKDYRSEDYLKAFSKLSSNELHSTSDLYSHFEVIKLWNSLQSTPNKVRYFTFSLVHNNHSVIKKIESLYSSFKYAYICHDQDTSVEHKHYHYVLMFPSPRSFASVANDLEIPVTMLQKVYSKKGILDYLTHDNDPNKHHYSLDDIHANFDVVAEKKSDSDELTVEDIKSEFWDLVALHEGRMSREEWLDKYAQKLCIVRHYGSRSQAMLRIIEISSGASLSSRSQFTVRTPVRKTLPQAGFPEIFPNSPVWLDHGSAVVYPGEPAKAQKKSDYRKPNPRSDLND